MFSRPARRRGQSVANTRYATNKQNHPNNADFDGFKVVSLCAPGKNRTSGTRFRKPVLYPLSYWGLRHSHTLFICTEFQIISQVVVIIIDLSRACKALLIFALQAVTSGASNYSPLHAQKHWLQLRHWTAKPFLDGRCTTSPIPLLPHWW